MEKGPLIFPLLTVLAFSTLIKICAASDHRAFPFKRHGLEGAVIVLKAQKIMAGVPEAARELWGYLYFPEPEKGTGYFADEQKSSLSPAPVILILPMLGGRNLWIEEQLAVSFANRGMASLILVLPEQFERRPFLDLPSGRLFLGRTVGALARNFAQAELDAGQWIEWLQGPHLYKNRLDSNRLGIAGISLGGILSSLILYGRNEIQAGVLLLAGANPDAIIMEGALTKKLAAQFAGSQDEIREALKPFNLENRGGARPLPPVMIVEAFWDNIIPKSSRQKLRQAFPSAKLLRLPAGHVSAALHLFWVKGKVARFFAENLK